MYSTSLLICIHPKKLYNDLRMIIKTNNGYKTVRIGKNRVLSYREFGNPNGKPMLYFHGWPGFRIETDIIAKTAEKYNIRIIAVDRPGYRGSTYIDQREIIDWPKDIKKFLGILKINKPSLMGVSGGTPYALACAYKIPDLLDKVIIVSGLPDLNKIKDKNKSLIVKIVFDYLSKFPRLLDKIIKLELLALTKFPKESVKLSKLFTRHEIDKSFNDALITSIYQDKSAELSETNIKGIIKDAALYSKSWDIDYTKISKEINFLHGTKDKFCLPESIEDMKNMIPKVKTTFLDGGHYLVIQQTEEIFKNI